MPDSYIRGVKYHYEWLGAGWAGSSDVPIRHPVIVCLHGFTGSWRSFEHLAQLMPHWQFLAIDLLGHGESSSDASPERFSLSQMAADLAQLINSLVPEPYILYGYSMGGRVALTMALTQQLPLRALIVENAQPGLSDADAATRRYTSIELADRITNHSIEEFVNYWESLPIFATEQELSPELRALRRKRRLMNSKAGLAASMRYANVGTQENLWPRLSAITVPFLYVSGSRDHKYSPIGERVAAQTPSAELLICKGAGHNVHEEKPEKLASMMDSWLTDHVISSVSSPSAHVSVSASSLLSTSPAQHRSCEERR